MGDNKDKRVTEVQNSPEDVVSKVINKPTTRRQFLKMAGVGGAGVAAANLVAGVKPAEAEASAANAYEPQAKFMIIQDPARCVGCKRCEVACSLAHKDKISTSLSGIKVSRNWSFGSEGPRIGFKRGQGMFGDCRIVADTCLQCAHPVPCMSACPNGAMEIDPKTNARVINQEKCKGCGICLKACPWAMTSFDKETKKATKCDLCGGDPECVKICPAGAISLVPWRDRSREIRTRQAVPASIKAATDVAIAESCNTCHKR